MSRLSSDLCLMAPSDQVICEHDLLSIILCWARCKILNDSLRLASVVLGSPLTFLLEQVICGHDMLDHNHVGKMLVATLQVSFCSRYQKCSDILSVSCIRSLLCLHVVFHACLFVVFMDVRWRLGTLVL